MIGTVPLQLNIGVKAGRAEERLMTKAPIDQLFLVPNNEEGRFFIYQLKKYLSPNIQVRVRGRQANMKKALKLNPRARKSHFWDSIPQNVADALGVYLIVKPPDNGHSFNLGASTIQGLGKAQDEAYHLRRAVREVREVLSLANNELSKI